jgi:class 3 adenylate cyclase
MGKLSAKRRTGLRDSAFAYIDPTGRRRLPIHDEPHVRAALSRFNQVSFADDAARDRARRRLLEAAKKYGIVPIGFVDREIRGRPGRDLPTGQIALLMTDIVDSSGLVARLAERYAPLLADSRRLIRAAVRKAGGHEVDARADEFFAVFTAVAPAIQAAIAIQRGIGAHPWPDDGRITLRAGLHAGRPTLTEGGYVGVAVHTTNRIASVARGGQIVMSRAVHRLLGDEVIEGVTFGELGEHRLRGIPSPELLFEIIVAEMAEVAAERA